MASEPVERFHLAISAMTAPLEHRHRDQMVCRKGCADCCVDGLSVFHVEADLIRKKHQRLLETEAPHPPGRCAFLDAEGACRIYDERPYVCRTQGLPLRWVEQEAGEVIECRDVCSLNADQGLEPLAIEAEACWSLGPAEMKLQELQRAHEPEAGDDLASQRVLLRALFRS